MRSSSVNTGAGTGGATVTLDEEEEDAADDVADEDGPSVSWKSVNENDDDDENASFPPNVLQSSLS
jgi:hypothetical protein